MSVLKVLFAIMSTLSFICFFLYTFALLMEQRLVFYSSNGQELWTKGSVAFSAFAAAGFLVCIYQGTEAMFYWMPHSWGSVDEYDTYVSLPATIASIFTASGGLILLRYLKIALHDALILRNLELQYKELTRILYLSTSDTALAALEIEFSERISELEDKSKWKERLLNQKDSCGLPDHLTRSKYSELIDLICKHRKTLN